MRALGVIDLPTMQRYLNLWYSLSLDLFGGEISSNAAGVFAAGLKGRPKEEQYEDHRALDATYAIEAPGERGAFEARECRLRNALNEVLRDAYVEDCQRGVDKWNRAIAARGVAFELSLPSRRFHRQVGICARPSARTRRASCSSTRRRGTRAATSGCRPRRTTAYVKSLMTGAVSTRSRWRNWIAPPKQGIKGRPIDFEYVRRA